ncbi:MAG: DUF4440 domain-containing protein [Saprospiraceae bacterium]
MKIYFITSLLSLLLFHPKVICAQAASSDRAIHDLIALYAKARDYQDTVLLKEILTEDIDQLVSTGEWRLGIREAITGMLSSTTTNPGARKLIVERVKFLDHHHALADARYEISNPDGTTRKMWSTFITIYRDRKWKITGIRNMMPAIRR